MITYLVTRKLSVSLISLCRFTPLWLESGLFPQEHGSEAFREDTAEDPEE
jgi:hypothetical protein